MKYRGTLLVVKDCKKALSFYSQMSGLELIQDNDGNMELSNGLFLRNQNITLQNIFLYNNILYKAFYLRRLSQDS